MNFLKNNKTTIGAIVICGLLLYVYFNFFRGSSSENLLTSSETVSEDSAALLATLASLRTIQLDNGIFSDPVFVSLTDFGVQIDPQNVGRKNPFAPLTPK